MCVLICCPSADQLAACIRSASSSRTQTGWHFKIACCCSYLQKYEGFPGKGAEDRGAVSSAETGLEEDVIDTIDILSRRQYLEKIIKFHMISMV